MNPNDYDNDGNNIVPCPICLDNYCPSKNGGECPEEEEFARYYAPKDIVYVFKAGSVWQDNELRYSLRSIDQYFDHRDVFIVGDLPDWIQNVNHIDVKDVFAKVHGGKFKNVIRKIIGACQDDRVSEDFVLMNDDFFFLKKTDGIVPYASGSLQSLINRYGANDRNQYLNALKRTMRLLNKAGISDPVNYAVHYPIVFNKKKFLQLTDEVDWQEKPASWRTLYGNLFKIGEVERTDPKISSLEALEIFLQKDDYGDFLSISDNIALDQRFQFWIEMQLPHKSKYEK